MIVLLKPIVSDDQKHDIEQKIQEFGYESRLSGNPGKELIAVIGETPGKTELANLMAWMPGVLDVVEVTSETEFRKGLKRRRFLDLFLSGLGVFTLITILIPVFAFVFPPRRKLSPTGELLLGPAAEFPENSAKRVDFHGNPMIVVNAFGRFHALNAVCTHSEICLVEWDSRRQQLLCPCHSGVFDVRGNVLEGPPPRPLSSYQVEVIEGNLLVRKGT